MERVDTLIERVMAKRKGTSALAQARYYEEVHQELAPLARDIERQRDKLLAMLKIIYPRALSSDYEAARNLIAEVEGQ